MKTPTKAELYAQVAALEKENIRLQIQLDAEKQKRWREKIDRAFEVLYASVPFLPREMYMTTLEHIDDTGYWFTYELQTDSRKQTYCVRHTDIKEVCE